MTEPELLAIGAILLAVFSAGGLLVLHIRKFMHDWRNPSASYALRQ